MRLELMAQRLCVCRFAPGAAFAWPDGLCFFARTDREVSLVCEQACAPSGALAREDGWRAFRVAGTLDFSLVGVLAGLSGTLAAAGVGLFAVSTYDTDYILVKEGDLPAALRALEQKGYAFDRAADAAAPRETAHAGRNHGIR